MNKADVQNLYLEFVRCSGGDSREAWEATAMTLLDRLNACEQLLAKLRSAAGTLSGDAADMVQSREAWRRLRDGFKGMGHNILTEKAGIWQSPSQWTRLGKSEDKVSKILQAMWDSETGGTNTP